MAKIRQKIDRAEWAKLVQDIQALYVERAGQYVLDSDDAEELRSAFERQKEEAAALKQKLAVLGDIDPAEYERLKEAAAKSARDKDLEKGNFDKILAEESRTHAAELKKREDRERAILGRLEESLVDGELTRAISTHPGARHKLLMPAAKQKVALREIGGRLRSVVLDDKGEPRLKPGAKAADEYMEPADLIAEMRNDKEYAGAFPAAAGGVGARVPLMATPTDSRSQAQRGVIESIVQQVKDGATKLS